MENEIPKTEIPKTEIPQSVVPQPEFQQLEAPQPVVPQLLHNRKRTIRIVAAVFSAFTLYYLIMSLVSPSRKISSINEEFGYKQPEASTTAPDVRIFSDSAFVKLNREKAFYQSRIVMAETDSICLALNLADSSAILEIDGVAVHKAKITRKRISKVFDKADEYAISSMLSTPFTIKKDFASIKKEPLMIKMAPKDTSEYKPDILPDTTRSEPVNYILETKNGIRLYFYQDIGEKSGDRISRFLFDLNDRFKNVGNNIKNIILLKVPEYHPYIKIRMAKADAKIIYRALPKHGQISVYR
jgi:hypothetical protein